MSDVSRRPPTDSIVSGVKLSTDKPHTETEVPMESRENPGVISGFSVILLG